MILHILCWAETGNSVCGWFNYGQKPDKTAFNLANFKFDVYIIGI